MKPIVLMVCVVSASLLTLPGCSSERNKREDGVRLTPQDFASTPADDAGGSTAAGSPGEATSSDRSTGASTTAAPPAPSAPADSSAASAETAATGEGAYWPRRRGEPLPPPSGASATGEARAYPVAGMVGQVNGRPIYASLVFKDIHEALQAMGRSTGTPGAFRIKATPLVASRLRQIVMDQLVLAEAERNLTEPQRYGLLQFLKAQREEIIRAMGEGSAKLADVRLREESGIGLEEKVEETRQKAIVQKYLSDKLLPRINVTRKDIERYYMDNPDRFNPQPGRTVHLIRTSRKSAADRIEQELASGRSFLDIAGDSSLNEDSPEKQGLFGKGIKGDKPFGPAELNEAMVKLREGEHSPRVEIKTSSGAVRYFWIHVAAISEGKHRTLQEAQSEIEQELRRQQFQALTEQYQDRLLKEGSYNSLEDMLSTLLDIAVTRYARAG